MNEKFKVIKRSIKNFLFYNKLEVLIRNNTCNDNQKFTFDRRIIYHIKQFKNTFEFKAIINFLFERRILHFKYNQHSLKGLQVLKSILRDKKLMNQFTTAKKYIKDHYKLKLLQIKKKNKDEIFQVLINEIIDLLDDDQIMNNKSSSIMPPPLIRQKTEQNTLDDDLFDLLFRQSSNTTITEQPVETDIFDSFVLLSRQVSTQKEEEED